MKVIKRVLARKKQHNQGNSYIMVVATLSFLAVLVAAILVAVALCYRLKAYDINARDNFYYLEQAMDEIYAGVGADSMRHLNTAYEDTLEVLVYFDSDSKSYVTMDNDEANRILKNSFIKLVKEDPNYKTKDAVEQHLKSFISYPYVAGGSQKEQGGVQISLYNVASTDDTLTMMNVVLKREAAYSTVNTRKSYTDDDAAVVADGDTFVQTITTDLVIGKPEFDVNFNTVGADLNDLYEFAMVADLGVEIGSVGSTVNITGNIYAAADFYNKDYNITDTSDANYIKKNTDKEKTQYAAVNGYASGSNELAACDGLQEKSMYSGIYVDRATVMITADKLIVPGAISAFNGADVTIQGLSANETNTADIWADDIVLGGYSVKTSATSDDVKGASLRLRANAYVYDDLELNAKASNFVMIGQYYGYNYSTLDNRTYTSTSQTQELRDKDNKKVIKYLNGRSTIASNSDTQVGKAHYNSSAIIINGEDSTLDLSSVSDMYVAGQAYIETSKKTTVTTKEVTSGSGTNQIKEEYESAEYSYPTKSKRETETTKVVNGVETKVTTEVDDNYTTKSKDVESGKESTDIEDYRTGEAISIKSNQLAYLVNIPKWSIVDTGTELYLKMPNAPGLTSLFKKYWDLSGAVQKIPIVKTVISGKTYYFFDFSEDATLQNAPGMNEFIAEYAKLFEAEGDETSVGEANGLNNITDYDFFSVEMLNVKQDAGKNGAAYASIYSNSAITVKDGTTFKIVADSSSIDPLITAAKRITNDVTEQNNRVNDNTKTLTAPDFGLSTDANTNETTSSQDSKHLSQNVTTALQSQYKEMKWMLTTTSSDYNAITDAHTMNESDITPINYFFYFNEIKKTDIMVMSSGYKVWISDKNLKIDTADFAGGNLKGMIICKGDVTFDSNVKGFEGLIVSGGKIKIDHSMSIAANPEIVKTILRECDESQKYGKTSNKNWYRVCELFQKYQSIYVEENSTDAINAVKTKNISAVQFEDILSFDNWKKNVD